MKQESGSFLAGFSAKPFERLRGAPSDTTPFFGRSDDLQHFEDLLRDAAAGQGSTTFIGGDGGAGKSALLRRYGETAQSTAHVIRACLGRVGHAETSLAAQLLGQLSPSGVGRLDKLNANARMYETITASSRNRTLVLLLDDVHLAGENDLHTIDAIVEIAFARRIVAIACFTQVTASPPPSLGEALSRWLARGALRRTLRPLSDNEMELLVRSRLVAIQLRISAQASNEIMRLARGKPRYACELLLELTEPYSGIDLIPYSAMAATSALRSSMPAAAYDVLAVSAVIGKSFRDEWLLRLGLAEDAIPVALQRGVDRGYLLEDRNCDGLYTFRDVAVQKALCLGIVTFRRRLLHQQIATLLQSVQSDGEFDDKIADHWEAAGDECKAEEWLARSAAVAAGRGEHANAAERYERAASHASDVAKRISLQEHAAASYEEGGLVRRAIPLREGLISQLDTTREGARLAQSSAILIADYFRANRPVDAMEMLQSVEHSKLVRPEVIVRHKIAWAMRLFHDNLIDEARATLETIRSRDLTTATRPKFLLASAAVNARVKPVEETLAALKTAADLSQRVTGSYAAAWLLMDAANLARTIGRLEVASGLASRAAQLAVSCDERTTLWTTLFRSELQLLGGNVASALELLRKCAGIRDVNDQAEPDAAGLSVLIGLHRGDASLIDAFFDIRLLQRAIAMKQAYDCGTLLRGFPEIMIARGMAKQLAVILKTCADERLTDPLFSIQLAIARFGPLESTELARVEICRREDDADGVVARAARLLFDAFVAKRLGNTVASVKAASLASDAYRGLHWPLHEALALEVAEATLDAQAIYEKCGASRSAQRLLRRPTRKTARAAFGSCLTPRERQIAQLACEGSLNPEIARKLGVGTRTVDHHMEAILSKLGIRSRWLLTPGLLSRVGGLGRRLTHDDTLGN